MHVCLSSCALHLSALLHCKIASHFIRRCCRSFFCPAHSLTPDRVFTPFFPSFLFFIRFFLSCSSVFAIEYAIGSRASICLSQKRNFWAKCQLCTLNIYRIAIYVIAWFSSTNIHALENCLISGSIFPSILCIIRSYFSSIANWWFDLLCVCVHVHAFTIYFCTASIGVCSFIRSFWLPLLCFKSIDCSFWQSISFEFCSSQISIILPLLLPNFLIRKASHDMNFYRK